MSRHNDTNLPTFDKYMIAHNLPRDPATPPYVEVGPWPDETRWTHGHFAWGYCTAGFAESSDEEKALRLVGLALFLISTCRIPSDMVFAEFAKIREWRDMDIPLPGGMSTAFIPGNYGELNPHNL